MSQPRTIVLPLLGLAHVGVAILLLPTALFLGVISMLIVIPGLIWLALLGISLCRPNTRVAVLLRTTHLVLAPFAVVLLAYGFFALRAAERSAEDGGGLLGGFGWIPIAMGVLAGSLSTVSLWVASWAKFPISADSGPGLESDPADRL